MVSNVYYQVCIAFILSFFVNPFMHYPRQQPYLAVCSGQHFLMSEARTDSMYLEEQYKEHLWK